MEDWRVPLFASPLPYPSLTACLPPDLARRGEAAERGAWAWPQQLASVSIAGGRASTSAQPAPVPVALPDNVNAMGRQVSGRAAPCGRGREEAGEGVGRG